jgi:diguanylate cyclase (GGDEF)-like protein
MDLTGITPLYPTTPSGRPAGAPGEIPGVRRSKVVRVAPDMQRAIQGDIHAGCADLPSRHAADAELPPSQPGAVAPAATPPAATSVSGGAPSQDGGGGEWPVNDPPRRISDKVTAVGAERQVLLWQRWARYVAAVLTLGAAVVQRFSGNAAHQWLALAGVALAYAGTTFGITWYLQRTESDIVSRRLLAYVLAADLVAAASAVYLTAAVRDYDRLLILGLVAVQLAVVYYGLSFAVWGLLSTLATYILGSLFLSPIQPGAPADGWAIVTYSAMFLFAGSTLVFAFGSFRSRMNALRRLCHDVEAGEFGTPLGAHAHGRPDDLSLLARSVDDMRHRLIELIGTDPLTECLNRRALETRLARECRQARRRGTPLSVLAIDVDHFKSINDTFGHPFGDYVLQTVADIMNETARDTDAVARLGGDEFILVLPDTGTQGATAFAERLRCNVGEHVFGDQRQSLPVTISVGVMVAPEIGELSPAALLAAADRNLYRAKSAGRNRISA